MNKWLVTNLQQQSHHLGDCPECSALCSKIGFDTVLGTPLGLVEALQVRLREEAKKSPHYPRFRNSDILFPFRNSEVCFAWLSEHKDWFGYERMTQ